MHHRMPVILHREQEDEWLNPDITEPERLLPLLRPYPDSEMVGYEVSRQVNSASVDTEALIQPINST